jgi:YD repeat-containing protein
VDPLNNITTYSYDGRGRETAVFDALGNRTTTVYDSAGEVQSTIDARGDRTTYLCDLEGRQTAPPRAASRATWADRRME